MKLPLICNLGNWDRTQLFVAVCKRIRDNFQLKEVLIAVFSNRSLFCGRTFYK